ncbi:MAG: hypothetical protein AAF411_03960 [Myxococcota bacterium]
MNAWLYASQRLGVACPVDGLTPQLLRQGLAFARPSHGVAAIRELPSVNDAVCDAVDELV